MSKTEKDWSGGCPALEYCWMGGVLERRVDPESLDASHGPLRSVREKLVHVHTTSLERSYTEVVCTQIEVYVSG